MDNDKVSRVKVTIGGSEYTLRGNGSETRLFDIARLVDTIMQEVTAANPNLDLRRAAVLTALNIAEEYYALHERYEELMDILDERSNPGR